MKLSSHVAFLLQLTAVSGATTKVLRKSVESTRSLSSSFNKQQEYLAKLPATLAENGNAVAAARHGSDVSVQCFTDTITDYDFEYDFDESVTDDLDCAAEGSSISCDFSSIGLSACTEAGGTIVRETLNYCEENFIATNYPTCVAPSCDNDVTYSEIMIDFALPITYALAEGEEVFMMPATLEEYIYISGFGGACPSAPKSSKSPSSKAPKSSKSPSSKAPKSSKSPSSKAPKAPSSKAPKSTKAPETTKAPKSTKTPKATSAPSSKAPKASTKSPKSTQAPGSAASSSGSATASMSAASVAAGALVWFSL